MAARAVFCARVGTLTTTAFICHFFYSFTKYPHQENLTGLILMSTSDRSSGAGLLLTFLRLSRKHSSYRNTHCLILAVYAAHPAARPTLSFLQLVDESLQVLLPRLVLLHGDDPAYPFVSRKGRQVFPLSKRRLACDERFAHIIRESVRRAASYCSHKQSVPYGPDWNSRLGACTL